MEEKEVGARGHFVEVNKTVEMVIQLFKSLLQKMHKCDNIILANA